MNVLFVCTMNRARSVTAERLYRGVPGLSVRSAGISERATHQVNEADLAWADRVVVFEVQQERWIRATFAGELPEIVNVGVADEFNVDDPELIADLIEVLSPMLGRPSRQG